MTHTSSFDIKTADDYFSEMLLPQYDEFINDNASNRHALLTIIIAYHLFEWVHKTACNTESFIKKYPNNTELAIDFDVARLITNGTKHFSNKAAVTRTQSGFSSGFSDGFARSLNIQYPDGSEDSVDHFLRKLIDFWKDQKDSGSL